jgi:hypothetical protein
VHVFTLRSYAWMIFVFSCIYFSMTNDGTVRLISPEWVQRPTGPPLTCALIGAPNPLWLVGPCRQRYKERWGRRLAVRGSPRLPYAPPTYQSDLGLVLCRREAPPAPPLTHANAVATMSTSSGSSSKGEGMSPTPSRSLSDTELYSQI